MVIIGPFSNNYIIHYYEMMNYLHSVKVKRVDVSRIASPYKSISDSMKFFLDAFDHEALANCGLC